jgi:hypothetical protein
VNIHRRRQHGHLVLQQDPVLSSPRIQTIRLTVGKRGRNITRKLRIVDQIEVNKCLVKAPIAVVSVVERNKVNAAHITKTNHVEEVPEEGFVAINAGAGNVDRVRVHLVFY